MFNSVLQPLWQDWSLKILADALYNSSRENGPSQTPTFDELEISLSFPRSDDAIVNKESETPFPNVKIVSQIRPRSLRQRLPRKVIQRKRQRGEGYYRDPFVVLEAVGQGYQPVV